MFDFKLELKGGPLWLYEVYEKWAEKKQGVV